jgi:L-iditol 2-dehydrogenase
MKIVLCEAPHKLVLQEAEIPRVHRLAVLVKIEYCGICSYDLKRFLGLKKIAYPVILGHEPSGEVVETGNGVRGIKKGDLVAVDVKERCGECAACLGGMESRCERAQASNGFSQYILVPAENVVKISSAARLKVATLTEPLACILHGFRKLKWDGTGDLLVVGDGIMGILAGFAGKVHHGKRVVLLGHHRKRLEAGGLFGGKAIMSGKADLPPLGPFDAVVLTVKEERILSGLKRFLYPGGRVLLIGEMRNGCLPFDLNMIYSNEFTVVGSNGYTREDFRDSLALIEKFPDMLGRLIDRVYGIQELETAFKDLQARKIRKGILRLHDEPAGPDQGG